MAEPNESLESIFEAQHRRLDAMFAALVDSLRHNHRLQDVCDAFARLREMLEAHVDQEDRLYYPVVQAIRPAQRGILEGLVDAHETFRVQLGEIAARLAAHAISEVELAVAEFVASFAAHEAAEEQILRRLDAELSD